jgi:multifunctional 2-oxoglutarate metabolism enzyme
VEDLTGETSFRPVIRDPEVNTGKVERALLCSGKIVWDLRAERTKLSDERTAILPVEQLYPLPVEQVKVELDRFPALREVRWVQDEPLNMGPWPFMALHLGPKLGVEFSGITRPGGTAPSCGSHALHVDQQRELLDKAFA